MPKLPVVSGAEAVRALGCLGFVVTRQRGSYIVMRRGSLGCVVPSYRGLKLQPNPAFERMAAAEPER